MCLLTNEKYKTYETGFSFNRLGHATGVGLGVPWGVGGPIFFQIQQDLASELLTSMPHGTANFFLVLTPGALGRGQKVKYHKISTTKGNFKDF